MATEVLANPVEQVSEAVQVAPAEQMTNLVVAENNRVTTTSLIVAKVFGKEHKNVIRDIENLSCSMDFNRLNFERITYKDARNRDQTAYEMTKDGFVFLVMGFTGKTAAKFKEAYIRAFNEMEAKLRREQEGQRRLKPVQPAHTMAEMPGLVSESLQRTAPIVESYGQQRVVSTVTLARLQGRSHEYVCESVRRMFKHVRPGRQFIRKTRTVRRGNGTGYEREDGVMYYITIEGFNTMRKHCTSISDDVAGQVMAAFRAAKGKNRPGQPNPSKPKAGQEAQPTAVTPNLPQTPADMMQRFVTAMAVMMGVDVNQVSDLMNNGGNK